jgi:hypothetical protein
MAITKNAAQATAAGKAGAPSIDTDLLTFNYSAAGCPAGTPPPDAVVTVTYTGSSLTGFFGSTLTLEGKGAMQCGG